MSLTLNDIQTNLNSFIGDTSTDRISAAERLQYLTEATVWVQQELGNDHQSVTYDLNYLDTVNYYKVTTTLGDLLQGGDLRREKDDNSMLFRHTTPRDIAESISLGDINSAWSIERRDGNSFIYINHKSKHTAKVVSDMDSLVSASGTWVVDAIGSDATNLTIDKVEYKKGNASLNFDVIVAQSVNNKATIQNTTLSSIDLSDYEDLGSWVFWIYVPDVTNFTSITLYWGDNTSNYWSITSTTDIDGSAWTNGWNQVKMNWANATKTSSPTVTSINYIGFDFNYGAGQTDDTDFRIDNLIITNPEKLKFYYISWNVGKDSTGTDITSFGNVTDVPYFSGQYDQYRYPVAHKAAELVYKSLRLTNEAILEVREASSLIKKIREIIPSSKVPESNSFKVSGIRFRR